jgi:Tol biopolymer transport system component
MNQTDRLERDLTALLAATAAPRAPDYTDDILRQTARVRQRPRWTLLERWLPMSEFALERVGPRPLPWRTIALLALLVLLVIGAVALYAGSRPRVPAPFGPANNGLVAYAAGGDIYTVDPRLGTHHAIVTGLDEDRSPRWSRDGTRLAFLRGRDTVTKLGIVDADGGNPVISTQGFVTRTATRLPGRPTGGRSPSSPTGVDSGRSTLST